MAESISLHCSAPDCDYETAERKKKKAEEEAKRKEDEKKEELRKLQQQLDAINAGGPGEKVDKGDKGDKREGDQQEEEPAKRGYPCPIPGCSSKCTSAKGLAVHLNSRKHISEDKMMPCSVCADNVDLSSKKRGQKFTPPSLREHTRRNHKQKVAPVSPKPPAKKATETSSAILSESSNSESDEAST